MLCNRWIGGVPLPLGEGRRGAPGEGIRSLRNSRPSPCPLPEGEGGCCLPQGGGGSLFSTASARRNISRARCSLQHETRDATSDFRPQHCWKSCIRRNKTQRHY